MEKAITININSIIDKLIVINGNAAEVQEQVEKALSGIISSAQNSVKESDQESQG